MSEMSLRDKVCERVMGELDSYLSNQLPAGANAEVVAHLDACAGCRAEMESRKLTRSRLKTAVYSVSAPPFLESRIRANLRTSKPRRGWQWIAAPVTAVLMAVVGVGIAYQLGYLRYTTASQEAYIRTVSNHVATLMRVGLGDHIHCTVFRKFPKQAPQLEQFVHQLGPEYQALVPVVKDQFPGDYRLMMAHKCRYHGRQFVHLTLMNDSRLVSLVISRKGDGESFITDELPAQLAQAGIPFYHAAVQRFQIASFETKNHLVYLVSDMPEQENMRMMLAIAPGVRAVLSHLEG
jgi:hypothetical protein